MSASLNIYSYLHARGYFISIGTIPLSAVDQPIAVEALKVDRDALFLNSLISYASMIHALNTKNYSWAFISSYYCIFYLTKTQLAIANYALFYFNDKFYRLLLNPGEIALRINGNSHEGVLNFYSTTFPNDYFVVNQIEQMTPFSWFKQKREAINYRSNPMTDPSPHSSLYDYKKDIRKWLHNYINDSTGSYIFSESHAYVALTTKFLDNIFKYYNDNSIKNQFLTDAIFKHLSNNIKDKEGPIDLMISRLKTIKS